MKTLNRCLLVTSLSANFGFAEADFTYINKIYQYQLGSDVIVDVSPMVNLKPTDTLESKQVVEKGGAEFVLSTVQTSPSGIKEYPLAKCSVGEWLPAVKLEVRSKDITSDIPRTRADEPFELLVTVAELQDGPADPEASKKVNLLRHVVSYGPTGDGIGLDRQDPAKGAEEFAIADSPITKNTPNATDPTLAPKTITFPVTMIPGGDRRKVRGEERFTAMSLPVHEVSPEGIKYDVDAKSLASQYIQVWPVADGKISGITSDTVVRFKAPKVTLTLNDLYPSSTTYAQVYKGEAVLGTVGKALEGGVTLSGSLPQNKVLTVSDYLDYLDENGRWTMEIITDTPFGPTRLDYVTFNVDQNIKLNGSFTTIETTNEKK